MGARRAKCVVVFADEINKRTSDARALRIVLALVRALSIDGLHFIDFDCLLTGK